MDEKILTIDVHDETFQKFAEAFKELDVALDAMPEKWRKLFRSVGDPEKPLKQATKAMDKMSGSSHKLGKNLHHASTGMTKLGHAANKTAHVMKGILGMGVRLGGIGLALGGISAAGGLFGLSELSNVAMRRRMSAKVAGMSVGKLAALNVAMSPILGNPSGVANAIEAAKFSPTGQMYLADTIGKQWRDMTRMGRFMAVMNKAQHFVKTAGPDWRVLPQTKFFEGLGLTQDDLMRLRHTKKSTLAGYEALALRNQRSLGFSNATAREWTALSLHLQKFKVLIGTDLISSLRVLAPQISQLTKQFGKWLSAVLTSKNFASWIKDADTGLKRLATFLGSNQFQTDISKFSTALNEATNAILWAGRAIFGLKPSGKFGNAGFKSPRDNPLNWSEGVLPKQFPVGVGKHAIYLLHHKNDKYMGSSYWKSSPYNSAAPYNWRLAHNPMNIHAYAGDASWHRKALYQTNSQSYQRAAAILEGYYWNGHHTLRSMVNMYESGSVKGNSVSNKHASLIAQMIGLHSANQNYNVGHARNLERLTYAMARFEEPHKRSNAALYETIKQAIIEGLRQGKIHLDVKNSVGSRLNVGSLAASMGP